MIILKLIQLLKIKFIFKYLNLILFLFRNKMILSNINKNDLDIITKKTKATQENEANSNSGNDKQGKEQENQLFNYKATENNIREYSNIIREALYSGYFSNSHSPIHIFLPFHKTAIVLVKLYHFRSLRMQLTLTP